VKAMVAPDMNPPDPQVAKMRDLPMAYQFYRGVELHPRFLGVGENIHNTFPRSILSMKFCLKND